MFTLNQVTYIKNYNFKNNKMIKYNKNYTHIYIYYNTTTKLGI